ncbi:hypothetical protein NA57DRAFT_80950 [Rhizodiscina lignyota]|uniref:Zn(2)-C6 fungal-type domain-containing protein n=1 Tax=Rhizodiscina lignyota TaxID=1504668 RepID=A0A9P4I742_9PEZI|nr:hypothetical protein NA57DRAFT_80950 [Rhizodiscina lignyota]
MSQNSKKTKGCWTCRSRKVRCDLTLPTCSNCLRASRNCQYGLRLSWPREGDRRRSIVSQKSAIPRSHAGREDLDPHVFNIGSSDIALYLNLAYRQSCSTVEDGSDGQWPSWIDAHGYPVDRIPRGLHWISPDLGNVDSVLLSYYESVIATMFTSVDDIQFRGLLVAMSFIDNSPSSSGVLQSVYALSALQLYGKGNAAQYKDAALAALELSTRQALTTKDRLQHIAANLLLCSYEICTSPESPWAMYMCHAKILAEEVFCLDQTYEGDFLVILQWIFHHDAFSRFSVRHYDRRTPKMIACAFNDQIRRRALFSGNNTQVSNVVGCSTEVLSSIATLFNTVVDHDDPQFNSLERIEILNTIERSLAYCSQHVDARNYGDASIQPDTAAKVAELYRLAGLVYLYRAGRGMPANAPKVRNAVESGLSILATLNKLDRAFPFVILGCEARTDEERLVVLDLLRRNQAQKELGTSSRAHWFIQTSWAQDDLHTEKEVNYIRKLDAIISLGNAPPSFS